MSTPSAPRTSEPLRGGRAVRVGGATPERGPAQPRRLPVVLAVVVGLSGTWTAGEHPNPGSREDQICLTLSAEAIPHALYAVWPPLTYWGGEAIYDQHSKGH
ncbi:hypothetical protein ACFU7Y_18270 [Kitasatospora sp. NPDC057542]|uniref:hypothetical protein n=1 Tax=Kitasatospora sp. NPDC057542 TaxID=3346162 RepID=UPI0036B087B0